MTSETYVPIFFLNTLIENVAKVKKFETTAWTYKKLIDKILRGKKFPTHSLKLGYVLIQKKHGQYPARYNQHEWHKKTIK